MLSAWASNIIAPASMNILGIALIYKSKKSQQEYPILIIVFFITPELPIYS